MNKENTTVARKRGKCATGFHKREKKRARHVNLLFTSEVPGFKPEPTVLASSLSSSPNMSRLLSSSLVAAVAVDILAVEGPSSISSTDDGWSISSTDDGVWLYFGSSETSSTSGKPSRARAKRSYPAAKAKEGAKVRQIS